MNRAAVLLGLSLFLSGLSAYIWRARPWSSVHQWFTALTLSIALWVAAIACLQLLWWPNVASRLAFASASLIPACLLAFSRVYPGAGDTWRVPAVWTALVLGATLSVLALFTNLLVHDVRVLNSSLSRTTGPLYPFFVLYFLTVWAALATFIAKWRRARGLARVQLQHLGIGLIIAGTGATTTNLLVPALTGSSDFSGLGPYFVVPLVALVAHAIVRHRLLDLRPVIHHGIALVLGIVALSTAIVAIARQSGFAMVQAPAAVAIVLVVTAVVFSAPVYPVVRRAIDQYLLTGQPDIEQALVEATSRLMRVMPKEKLAAEIVRILRTAVQPETVTLLVGEPGRDRWEIVYREHEAQDLEPRVRQAWDLDHAFRSGARLLEAEANERDTAAVAGQLRAGGIEVWIGLKREAVAGVLLLGPRQGGPAYFAQQLRFLDALGPLIAAALEIDILHRRQLELERARARDAHLARMAHVYAGLAHEIRTPLTTISNFVSILPERLQDPEYRELLMRLVPAEVARIVGLAERLRALAPGNPEAHGPVDLNVVLADAIALRRAGDASEREVKVALKAGDVPPVRGDADALAQLFGNLIQNAIEASPNGGNVWVTVRRTGPMASVEIFDEGPGIPAEVRARLFEPFLTTKRGGTGLGLSICREIAHAHHAELRFDAGSAGVGTAAIVTFPVITD